MLVQLPVPDQLSEVAIANRIHPDKDVDGFAPVNLGRLIRGEPGLGARARRPGSCGCSTAPGSRSRARTPSWSAAVLIVGKPMALLLTARSATVTVAHSRTRDLPGALPHGGHPRRRRRAARR